MAARRIAPPAEPILRPPWPDARWRRVLSYGLLWAVAAAAMESFALPLAAISPADLLLFVTQNLATWSVTGVALAAATVRFERHLTTPFVAPAVVVFSGLVAIVSGSIIRPLWELDPVFGEGSEAGIHVFWESLFYGGLFVAAYRLSLRSERTRGLLAQAEIARHRTETLLSTERMRALQGHVAPAFLLQVMVEVKRRHLHDRAGVDQLMDRLVGFLRVAMPGVRSGASSVSDEVQVAMQYGALRAELEPNLIPWRFDIPEPVPEAPFPPLLLLPVIDCLAANSTPQGALRVQVRDCGGRCRLTIECTPCAVTPRLPDELSHRLQVGLRERFGDLWTLDLRAAGAAVTLELTLPAVAAETAASPPPASSPPPKETIHE